LTSPSATPSSFPSSTPSDLPLSSPNDCVPQKNFCKHNEDKLLIEYKTDWSSQNQTTIYIDKQNKKGGFKNLMRFEDFPRNVLLTYGICLRKKRCHRFRIYRKKGNGLGKRWYKLFWEGKEASHDPFTDGKKQTVLFGNCTINISVTDVI